MTPPRVAQYGPFVHIVALRDCAFVPTDVSMSLTNSPEGDRGLGGSSVRDIAVEGNPNSRELSVATRSVGDRYRESNRGSRSRRRCKSRRHWRQTATSPEDGVSKRYSAWAYDCELGSLAVQRDERLQAGRRVMRQIAEATEETVVLAELDGIDVIYIDKIEGTRIVGHRMEAEAAQRLSGKACWLSRRSNCVGACRTPPAYEANDHQPGGSVQRAAGAS